MFFPEINMLELFFFTKILCFVTYITYILFRRQKIVDIKKLSNLILSNYHNSKKNG